MKSLTTPTFGRNYGGALMETDYEELRNNIIVYDWNQRKPLDDKIYRETPLFKLKDDRDRDREEITE